MKCATVRQIFVNRFGISDYVVDKQRPQRGNNYFARNYIDFPFLPKFQTAKLRYVIVGTGNRRAPWPRAIVNVNEESAQKGGPCVEKDASVHIEINQIVGPRPSASP